MTEKTQTIKHEAEVQRQHIRIAVPIKIMLEGRPYTTCDWSNGGVAFNLDEENKGVGLKEGKKYKAEIYYNFNGFSFNLPVSVEIRYVNKGANGRVGCRFVDLTQQQISMLQFMVSAYTAGEIVQAGDILDVAGRNNFKRARSIPKADEGLTSSQKATMKFNKIFRFGVVTVVFASLVGYVLLGIYERSYVVESSAGQVVADMVAVDAPTSGKVYFKAIPQNSTVKSGELLLTVAGAEEQVLNAESPCDCIVKHHVVENNSFVRKNETVLYLLQPDAKAYVEVKVPNQQAVRLKEGMSVRMKLPNVTTFVFGKIKAIEAGKDFSNQSIVVITPDVPLPIDAVDDPVTIYVDTAGLL